VRALVLKPHAYSYPGLIGEAATERGIELVEHVASEDERIPEVDGFDLLVCMGAPWSVYGDEVAPWIGTALERFRSAVQRDVPVLGICFGAQAFAEALGGEARRALATEVGWRQVETDDAAVVPPGPWFMWHSDTFTLPPGARELARTPVGPQAFALGPHLCVQFHPEITPWILGAWIEHDDEDFRRNGVDPERVLEQTRAELGRARVRARELLNRVLVAAEASSP
jgi:GMP synthase-like glutamine amidotransferase